MLTINFTRSLAKSILFFAAVSAQAQGLLWHQLAPGTYQVPGTLNTFVQSTYSCVLSMDQPVALPNGLLLNGPTIDFDSFLYQTFVYQAATDAQFVVSAYQCVLFRDADTISYANSLAALKSGMSRGQFVASVLNSAEYQSHIKPQLLLLH